MTLKDLRLKRGLTQDEASKILEITIAYLSMLENGNRNPSDNLKVKLAKLYNCSVPDIFLACKSTKCRHKKKGAEE